MKYHYCSNGNVTVCGMSTVSTFSTMDIKSVTCENCLYHLNNSKKRIEKENNDDKTSVDEKVFKEVLQIGIAYIQECRKYHSETNDSETLRDRVWIKQMNLDEQKLSNLLQTFESKK